MFDRRKHDEDATVDVAGRVGGGVSGPDELSPEAADWLLTRLERWHEEREPTSS